MGTSADSDGRFTLVVGNWYAAEISEGSSKESRLYSPILIEGITPARTGKRHFELSFYHADYPEGVRDKTYELQTIERSAYHLLAKCMGHESLRILCVSMISWEWIRTHYPKVEPNHSIDVQQWLFHNA